MKQNTNKWKKIRRDKLGIVPQEASQNLFAPEIAPFKKDKLTTKRLKPLGLRVEPEFYWQIKALALKEKCLMIEIIERAVEEFKNKLEREEEDNEKILVTTQ